MKFTIAVVMLALAVANASVLPLAYSPYGVPLTYAPGISLSQGLAGLSYSAYPYNLPAAYNLGASVYSAGSVVLGGPVPAPVVAAAAPAPTVAVAAPLVAGPAASYVATTRGAQHVAPLPGHVQSVASNNVQPAPGTL